MVHYSPRFMHKKKLGKDFYLLVKSDSKSFLIRSFALQFHKVSISETNLHRSTPYLQRQHDWPTLIFNVPSSNNVSPIQWRLNVMVSLWVSSGVYYTKNSMDFNLTCILSPSTNHMSQMCDLECHQWCAYSPPTLTSAGYHRTIPTSKGHF